MVVNGYILLLKSISKKWQRETGAFKKNRCSCWKSLGWSLRVQLCTWANYKDLILNIPFKLWTLDDSQALFTHLILTTYKTGGLYAIEAISKQDIMLFGKSEVSIISVSCSFISTCIIYNGNLVDISQG
jgi:hypothetical protein